MLAECRPALAAVGQETQLPLKGCRIAPIAPALTADTASMGAVLYRVVLSDYDHLDKIYTHGKTARGASSPAKPALHIPEPLSITRAATSSSIMIFVYLLQVSAVFFIDV